MAAAYPIIDSHIHLFPSSELSTLAWCAPSHALHAQHSVAEYRAATGTATADPSTAAPTPLEGFIFIETDRTHDLESGAHDGSGWEMPLREVAWLQRIATGAPRAGEGHSAADAKLCLGIVPWAPVPGGEAVLERYLDEVRRVAGESWGKVRGVRYLVQDKGRGTMLREGFVEGLRALGRRGLVFDLGVDQRGGGRWQLEEAAEMIERAHEGVEEKDKVVVVISTFSF